MNIWDIVIIAAVLAVLALSFITIRKQKKARCSSDCSKCGLECETRRKK